MSCKASDSWPFCLCKTQNPPPQFELFCDEPENIISFLLIRRSGRGNQSPKLFDPNILTRHTMTQQRFAAALELALEKLHLFEQITQEKNIAVERA